MKTYWISWYHDPATMTPFTLYSPWWITGEECGSERVTVCALVKATDAYAAWLVIEQAYDEPPEYVGIRFVTEKPDGWRPGEDRFPPADWMRWED